ncbi:MAG: hypothetical protein V4719_06880 [Planctomycetota bacterium]
MSVWFLKASCRQARQLMLCAAVVTSFGCSGSDHKITGKVTGKVTYQGAPVTAGVVYLNSSTTGTGGTGVLGEDGKFTIAEPIEAGEYKVTVTPPPPPPPRADQAPPPPVAKVTNIPNKYWTEAKSDLKATVDEGDNVLEFDLKP